MFSFFLNKTNTNKYKTYFLHEVQALMFAEEGIEPTVPYDSELNPLPCHCASARQLNTERRHQSPNISKLLARGGDKNLSIRVN